MKRFDRANRRRRGTSMLEVVLAAAVLVLVMGSVTQIEVASTRTFRTGSVRSHLQSRAHRTLDRISRELRIASATSLAGFPLTPLWDDAIVFDSIAEVAPTDGTITWQSLRITFEYAPGETNDGVDNDGNGLVDEGRVVLFRNWNTAAEQKIVLCNDAREYLEGETAEGTDENGNDLIDERGLCFELDGNRLTIRLTLEKRDSEARVATTTLETTVHLRN